MCGRFTLIEDPADAGDQFPDVSFPAQFASRFNIAPSQPVLAIRNDRHSEAEFLLWGLIPSWAKDPTIGSRLINARGETLAEKPAFRGPFKHKRCLILADGFYEWKSTPAANGKVPHFVRMKTGGVFTFAGLWDDWHGPDGASIRTCTIVTTTPNELMASIHNRMPLILGKEDREAWLGAGAAETARLQALINPFPAERMEAYPVSTLVNNPANDRPECVLPA
jgi:putative SOS response-associated peptidase YedK